MKLDVIMAPSEIVGRRFDGQVAVVIDQLRATSTITAALDNGCEKIYPVASVEEAFNIRDSLAPTSPLLGGERKGLKIEGFDLGNSPLEYTREMVAGKSVVLTTTNGTKAIKAAKGADQLVTCSFSNLSAVASWLSGMNTDTVVICAGRDNRISPEDAVCAGYLIKGLKESMNGCPTVDDGGIMAETLAQKYSDPLEALKTSQHGKYLLEIDMSEDLLWCSAVDRYDFLVMYKEGYLFRNNG